jgi:hypothetical protein
MACNDFHEESTCYRFHEINEERLVEVNNHVGFETISM